MSVYVSGVSLCGGHNDDVIEAYVRGTGDGEEDGFGDVFVCEGCEAFVNVFRSCFVAFVADE